MSVCVYVCVCLRESVCLSVCMCVFRCVCEDVEEVCEVGLGIEREGGKIESERAECG